MSDLSTAGLIKLIRVTLLPGHRARFLHSQEIWNRETRKSPGYLGELTGEVSPNELYVITFWTSRADYERWMAAEHDRIAANAGSEAHYKDLDVHLIDAIGPS